MSKASRSPSSQGCSETGAIGRQDGVGRAR